MRLTEQTHFFSRLSGSIAGCRRLERQPAPRRPPPDLDFPTVLYGAAYYNEYMPQEPEPRLPAWKKMWP